MITCPNCGGNPYFDIASQKMLCSYCHTYFDVETFPDENMGAEMHTENMQGDQPDMMEVNVYTCSQCGGQLMSMSREATAFCSYCGSHQILEEKLSLMERPKHIIPFKITKEDCKKIYARKLRKHIFAPRGLKSPEHIEEFRGIYMPYWSYDYSQNDTISLNGTIEHREGDYRIIENYSLYVDANNQYKGITHDASTTFEDNISESLSPYDTTQVKPFKSAYLSGFYADIPDVKMDVYEPESAAMAARDTIDIIEKVNEFKRYKVKEYDDKAAIEKTHTQMEDANTAMFPVWFLSYRKKDRIAYAAINAQSGKMSADIPISFGKYLLGSALLAAIIWIILEFVNISSLRGLLLAVIFGAMAGSLVYAMVVFKLSENINNRKWESRLRSDGAFNNTNKNNINKRHSSPGIGVILIIWLILIAIALVLTFLDFGWGIAFEPFFCALFVQFGFNSDGPVRGRISNWVLAVVTAIGAIIWAVNPYIDMLYYAICILMMICVVWCFYDALYYYNQLMSRPLPQFDKGGRANV